MLVTPCILVWPVGTIAAATQSRIAGPEFSFAAHSRLVGRAAVLMGGLSGHDHQHDQQADEGNQAARQRRDRVQSVVPVLVKLCQTHRDLLRAGWQSSRSTHPDPAAWPNISGMAAIAIFWRGAPIKQGGYRSIGVRNDDLAS
jgi:hypothetical protein